MVVINIILCEKEHGVKGHLIHGKKILIMFGYEAV